MPKSKGKEGAGTFVLACDKRRLAQRQKSQSPHGKHSRSIRATNAYSGNHDVASGWFAPLVVDRPGSHMDGAKTMDLISDGEAEANVGVLC